MTASWRQSFASRRGLVLIGVVAVIAALLIAWATVLAHTLKVARAKPVGSLRYE